MAKTFSRAALLAAVTVSLAGCTQLDNAIASVPYLAMMRNAPFFDPYEAPLNAPPGSIPFDGPQGTHMAPQEATEAAISVFAASPAGRNPYAHGDSAVLAHGQTLFERHCSVCHNKDGRGNGPIVGPGKFPMGPSLITPGRTDGYIYGIIRSGRGIMPSYGARTSHADRWAIATYVTYLQGQAGTTPAATPTTQTPAPAAQENK
ncbi:MAG: cytochrome c [Longimicrobiales bacterium]